MEIKNKEFFTEIKYQIEKLQIAYGNDRPKVTQLIAEFMYGMIQDYEDVNNDKKRLVREIDVILCGKDAAQQASLCDLIPTIRDMKNKLDSSQDYINNLFKLGISHLNDLKKLREENENNKLALNTSIKVGNDIQIELNALTEKHEQLLKNQKAYLEAIRVNNMVLTEIYSHFGNKFDLKAQTDTENLLKTNKIILE